MYSNGGIQSTRRSQMSTSLKNDWYENFTVLAVVLIIITTILVSRGRRKIILANRIPGPRGSFIIGNLNMAFGGSKLFINKLFKEYRKYEKSLFKLWILNRLVIVLTKPEDIETVLNDPKFLKKSMEYNTFKYSIMEQGLFTTDDIKQWRNNRKMVIKGLNFTLLKSYVSIFFKEANVLAEILHEKRDLKTNDCDISDPINMATMEMIGKTALDVTFDAQRNGRNTFLDNLHTVMNTWEYRITHPWYMNNVLYYFSSIKRKHDQSQKIINEYVDDIIISKINELNINERFEINMEVHDEAFYQKKPTIIEILLQHANEMSHAQIRGEVVTILLGGQETTALANACAIFMLAHHQSVQDKVYEEIQSIFSTGDHRREPTYGDLQQMKYLEQVIKETLRLHPSLPIIGRNLDCEAKIGDYLCPAGATLLILPLLLHSSPLYYADPIKFNPDNFSPEAMDTRHPYTWIPFSAGLRNCIGIKYAMLQMKTILSTLVRKFKFSPSDRCPTTKDLKLRFMITLKLKDGCYVKIEPRT